MRTVSVVCRAGGRVLHERCSAKQLGDLGPVDAALSFLMRVMMSIMFGVQVGVSDGVLREQEVQTFQDGGGMSS